MKIVEFRRHSIKDGAGGYMLGPEGYAFARRVAQEQLRGRGFTHFYVSELWRTHQTLAAFAEGAGDFDLKRRPKHDRFFDLLEPCEIEIVRWHEAAVSGDGEYDAELVSTMVAEIKGSFDEWFKRLPDNSHVLVIGHSPLLQFVAFSLLGEVLPGLAECCGFRIVAGEDGTLRLDADSPDLDATTFLE